MGSELKGYWFWTYQNKFRVYDDECIRPDPQSLEFIRGLVKKGISVTAVRKVYTIYKPRVELGGSNVNNKRVPERLL